MTGRDGYRQASRGGKLEGRTGDRRHGTGETEQKGKERQRCGKRFGMERELEAWQSDRYHRCENRDAPTKEGPLQSKGTQRRLTNAISKQLSQLITLKQNFANGLI